MQETSLNFLLHCCSCCSNSYQQSSPNTCSHPTAHKMQRACPTKGRCDHSPCYALHWITAAQAAEILVCTFVLHSLFSLSKQPYFELQRWGRIVLGETSNLQVNESHQMRYTFCYLLICHFICLCTERFSQLCGCLAKIAAYRGHGEFLNHELHNLFCVLFTKASAQSRSIWLLFTLHSCSPEIIQHWLQM